MREPSAESVSVIVTAFNGEAFVRSAIETIRAQTMPVREIVLVDDASTDRTREIARELGVVVLALPHGGVSAARNAGIEAATGDWLAFLDVDDLWHPRKIELQLAAARAESSVGLVFTDYDAVAYDTGRLLKASVVAAFCTGDGMTERDLCEHARVLNRDAFNERLAATFVVLPSASMIRRSLARELGGFCSTVRTEDADFFVRASAIAPVAFVAVPLVAYVQHPAQISASWKLATEQLAFYAHVMSRRASFHATFVAALRKHYPILLYNLAVADARGGRIFSAIGIVSRAVLLSVGRGSAAALLRAIASSAFVSRLLRLRRAPKIASGERTTVVSGVTIPWRIPREAADSTPPR